MRLGLAGATRGIAVKTVVTAGELGVFGALDGVLVGQFGSFWTTRRTSSRNRAARESSGSSIGCRAATSGLSPDQKCKPALEVRRKHQSGLGAAAG